MSYKHYIFHKCIVHPLLQSVHNAPSPKELCRLSARLAWKFDMPPGPFKGNRLFFFFERDGHFLITTGQVGSTVYGDLEAVDTHMI